MRLRQVLVRLTLAAAVAVAVASASAQTAPTLDEVMTRAAAYLKSYGDEYAATIASEHYVQTEGIRNNRILDSEFGIVRLPGESQWLGFRDVLRVDGQGVVDRATRLSELFSNASASRGFGRTIADQAWRIVEESARFNLGSVQRTINNPALVLELLDPRHKEQFRFSKSGEDTVNALHAWRIRFTERGRPTIVKTSADRDVPSTGEMWIDPITGRLLRANVSLRILGIWNAAGRVFFGDVGITFKEVPGMQVWLPDRMTETYRAIIGRPPVQTGEATYTNYRRFRVETEEQLAK